MPISKNGLKQVSAYAAKPEVSDFLNDGRADEARRTGNEDTHIFALSKFLSSLRRIG
jgi:hypothetical protein